MLIKLAILVVVILNQLNLWSTLQEELANFVTASFTKLSFQEEELASFENVAHLEGEIYLAPLPVRNSAVPDFETEAKAALVLDVGTDKVLYQKNGDEELPMASLTKLMTALVILNKAELTEIVTVSKEAVETEGVSGHLFPGEEITVKNLLYALLVESSNDAAVALSQHISGSVEKFVKSMNQKAKTLGLKKTHFANPSGLDENGNYSTAYELAQLTDAVLDKPLIWEMLRTQEIDIQSVDGKTNHHLENTNQLLDKLPHIVGGKTGYTEEAGRTLILVIGHPTDNHQIITVVLDVPDRFGETEKLVNWVFEAYQW
ncbi:MAG TPA: D-alanyl-D-alanine carboxypeptidase [Candidatus Portnoybacteria bacterium]|nr:D-alanyl-D-alanine carboxypeptidase [Candidatus Portnoybacteria bacterium]